MSGIYALPQRKTHRCSDEVAYAKLFATYRLTRRYRVLVFLRKRRKVLRLAVWAWRHSFSRPKPYVAPMPKPILFAQKGSLDREPIGVQVVYVEPGAPWPQIIDAVNA